MPSRARWTLQEIDEGQAALLAGRCGLRMPAARVLWGRGRRTKRDVEQFLHARLTQLEDPFLMAGMEEAVARVRAAVRNREKILLYGDYDVDGVASVVILLHMLDVMGHAAAYHVPDRLKDGYGMQPEVIGRAARGGVTLIISVDTGIRAFEAAESARAAGADLIITDHHLPERELPRACAVLNPNQPGCGYPNKHLCGAGVTFKLIQALMERENWAPDRMVRFLDSFLIMAALATVADVVPLTGENRVMVQRGLEGLSKTRNPGLRALLQASGLDGAPVNSSDLGFRIAPRINAAGRMDHAREVIELFTTRDEERARAIAARLETLNMERQRTGEAIVREIVESYGGQGPGRSEAGLVFYSPEWHRGVVGIVANRVAELYHRPVIVLGRDERTGLAQGSGRSVPGFHLLSALERMPGLFVKFGGHRQAVGVTLDQRRVDELRQRFNEAALASLNDDDLAPELACDAGLRLDEINDASATEVLSLAPYGLGNRQPLFLVRGVEVKQAAEAFGKGGEHVRVRLWQGPGSVFTRAWRSSPRLGELAADSRVDAVVTVDDDAYAARRGYAPWSVTLRDFRPAE